MPALPGGPDATTIPAKPSCPTLERPFFGILKCEPLCRGRKLRGMPMRRRNETEIMAEILSLCRHPQKKTRIMYQTNLSWKIAKEYLETLLSKELLQVHHSEIRYATTQKGLDFLEKWEQCTAFLTVKDKKRVYT
jgi:predicted transcriptional regulator